MHRNLYNPISGLHRLSRSEPSAWWVALPLAAAAVLRFYNLSGESIWFDEAVSIRQASLPFWEMIKVTGYDNYPPLHNIALFVSFRMFGVTEFAARLPSAMFDIATVGVAFLLGRLIFSTPAGLITAWLIAFSSFHIAYAQEARMYTAFAFFATLSIFTFVRYLERQSAWTRLGYIIATALLLYTHPYAVFVVAAENFFALYLLLRYHHGLWRRLIDWIFMQVLVLALFAPWLPTLIDRTRKVQEGFWISTPSLEVFWEALRAIAGGQLPLILGLIAFVGIAWRFTRSDNSSLPLENRMDLQYWEKVGLLALWFVMLVPVPFLLSHVLQPFFLPRYTIAASPAWQLAVALGLNNWCRNKSLRTMLITALFLAAMLPTTVKAYRSPWAADWRSAVALIEETRISKW